jgi:hypothetical protein
VKPYSCWKSGWGAASPDSAFMRQAEWSAGGHLYGALDVKRRVIGVLLFFLGIAPTS